LQKGDEAMNDASTGSANDADQSSIEIVAYARGTPINVVNPSVLERRSGRR
jgi:hypothetical protein